MSYEEKPIRIIAREVKDLRNKDIAFVKVLWRNHHTKEATWEWEDEKREKRKEKREKRKIPRIDTRE